ncbi:MULTISPECIES: hypothetical protein [Aneurinibacillus]|uniref:YqbQ/XkdQ domain-containing protein n=1 Tax=Aneurinibacillus thermoaerophilus TaxID=143495 RepID=A0ABX8YDG6_ANETH|nr:MULTISPECIES: hypothetical protein [Aneurinibacillus]AMA74016.1 hypothetical protein ACH33_15000 [Aneurinibacillus sp. XH2]MED0675875.1 hypothetical protein [Aneurinibacillus thermoaerophilus]MED0737217.1 hypothetical protein [Aneurinibacillus thermoaerophilus]QYY43400.1 hypothetical protein K3F53_03870 [Aneurinibacillus thermoaerophilus]
MQTVQNINTQDFAVVYGKQNVRHILTDALTDLSWSSNRDEITQTMTARLRNAPPIQEAGMLMCFAKRSKHQLLNQMNQFFHGPIISWEKNEFTDEWEITAKELGWYLTKNDGTRPYLKGEAGAELQRYIQSTGVDFRCPNLGFSIDERYGTRPHSEIVLDVLQKAYEHTGYRFYIEYIRTDQSYFMVVTREGRNTRVPVFVREQMEASSIRKSIEDVYTVVTAQKWKDDKVVSSVTKKNDGAIKNIGRMGKIIEVEEGEDPAAIATYKLYELSNPRPTKKITVRHSDHTLSGLRAGWLVLIQEEKYKSKWVVVSADTTFKNGVYTVQLTLEGRE